MVSVSARKYDRAVVPRRSPDLVQALRAVAPGTALREGLDRVLKAKMGALIVVGDGPEVLNICSGGFLLDAAFSPQRLSELAKMDGAIILASDASRIARANVHLVPDPNVPTSETGTRHRTAERVARSIGIPVISVSEDLSIIAVYVRSEKHPLEDIPRLLNRANQAQQALERYKTRLDAVSGALSALEVEDLVTLRDVLSVLQRTEMVMRIADEIAGYIVELGVDGRLVRLQLDEQLGGIEDDGRLVVRDYFVDGRLAVDRVHHERARRPRHRRAGRPASGRGRRGASRGSCEPISTARCSRSGYRLLSKIPRLPDTVIESVVERFGTLHKIMRATIDDLVDVEGVGTARGPGDQGRVVATRREQHPRPLLLTDVSPTSEIRRPMRIELPSGTPAELIRPSTEPSLGVVIAPDIFGLASTVRRSLRVPRRAAELGGRARSSRFRAARSAVSTSASPQ